METGKLKIRKQLLEQSEQLADDGTLQTLREKLGARYAFEYLSGLYTKTTVSELKIAAM